MQKGLNQKHFICLLESAPFFLNRYLIIKTLYEYVDDNTSAGFLRLLEGDNHTYSMKCINLVEVNIWIVIDILFRLCNMIS
jgi:hypothetical protein